CRIPGMPGIELAVDGESAARQNPRVERVGGRAACLARRSSGERQRDSVRRVSRGHHAVHPQAQTLWTIHTLDKYRVEDQIEVNVLVAIVGDVIRGRRWLVATRHIQPSSD